MISVMIRFFASGYGISLISGHWSDYDYLHRQNDDDDDDDNYDDGGGKKRTKTTTTNDDDDNQHVY